jgi:hypothetical protein
MAGTASAGSSAATVGVQVVRAALGRGAALGWVDAVARWRIVLLALSGTVLGWSGLGYHVADYTLFAREGLRLLGGHLDVYAHADVQAGPLELLAFAPFGALDAVRPGLGAGTLAVGGTAAAALGALAAVRWARRGDPELSASPRVELAVGALALGWGACQALVQTGHPAQVAAPLLWFAAARAARSHRPVAAGALLGLAAGWETWGVIAAGVLLLGPRGRELPRAVAAIAGTCSATYLPFVLSGHFTMSAFVWPVSPGSLVWALMPDPAAGFGWGWRLAQGGLAVLAGAGVTLATRGRRDAGWLVPMAAVAVRLVLDPVLYDYYWMPLLVLALLALASTDTVRPAAAGPAAVLPVAVLAWWSALTPAHTWPATLVVTVPLLLMLTFRPGLGCRS